MVVLSIPQPTVDRIDAAVAAAESRSFDYVVRGSSIGHACDRHLWYRFRWAHEPEQFDGRKLRLFHTGHVEEARMVAWLRLAGVTVQDVDPQTGAQWEVVELDGHFKGHTDGIVEGLLEAPKTPHLLECKTHNTKSFLQLKQHGVAVSKPEHVAQMQSYMHLLGLTRAFYLAKNKETDELYSERIEYDPAHGAALIARAARIKDSSEPLARVSDDPNYFLCKSFGCPSYQQCHAGAFALRNCRTCLHSTPVAEGRWHCDRHDRVLSYADQVQGCPNHLYLPGLVPGRADDADEEAETVTYILADGCLWVDGDKQGRAA
jgi:hypothetical protein